MKHKADKEFRQLRIKLFLRTMAMLAIAVAAVYVVYSFFLRGNFANGIIAFLQKVFGMGYEEALGMHERIFRRNMDAVIFLSILAVFVVLFRIYLRWFSRYFEDISRGMDALQDGAPGEITLAPELFPIERKMNLARHGMERQRAEMLLSEQRKNDLVMYLAHDLKTPLASSVSYLHLLQDEKGISEELREKYLSISIAKAEYLEDQINEFLEIAKYNLSGVTLQCGEIDLGRLLEQVVYEFQPILAKKGLTCHLEAVEGLMMKGDGEKLQRVFDNLLRNAVLYSYEGTEVLIAAERGDEGVVIRFCNYGDTIPEDKLGRVFEQFYRVNAGRSTEGTGLGLAIARQIVLLHGGTIEAFSEEGRTVFTVVLPS